MEQLQNIQSVIEYFSDIYSSWQEINRLLKNKIQNPNSGDLSSQEFLFKFYNKNKEPNVLQTNLLNLILASSAEKAGVITTPLLALLRKNIFLFERNKEILENLNSYKMIEQSLLYYYDKRVSLEKDLELIKTYPYPTEVERQILIDETRKELSELSGEEEKERNRIVPFCQNFFPDIYQLSRELVVFINAFVPEKVITSESVSQSVGQNISPGNSAKSDPLGILDDPNRIFRTRMFEKFLVLERKLITDKYLKEESQNKELHWISTHENGKPDIKRLVTFLAGMLDNNHFLPNKDPKIKAFFESRYHIVIGQNFERKRRVPLLNEYKIVFHNYPF
ncbi:MAG: hypothetical protein Q8R96_01795 [Bacteroidota bacterium]|nr:hypothetical protein [Bacteroidota bacterium]